MSFRLGRRGFTKVTAAALATFLARSDVAPAAKTTGDQLSHRLSDLQPKIAATKTRGHLAPVARRRKRKTSTVLTP